MGDSEQPQQAGPSSVPAAASGGGAPLAERLRIVRVKRKRTSEAPEDLGEHDLSRGAIQEGPAP